MLLHYAQNSRAVRVAWLLEELNIEYDIKKYAIRRQRTKRKRV